MKNLALPVIQSMPSYEPPSEGRLSFKGLRLDFNERVQQPVYLREVLQGYFESAELNVYPEYEGIDSAIATYASVSDDQVMITNGSDQAIELIFRTFTEPGSQVIIPSPSFPMFYQSAAIIGTQIHKPAYDSNLKFPTEAILEMVSNETKLIVVCNPNNPTGTAVSVAEIERIAQNAPQAIILVDEAYYEFSQITAVKLLESCPNILITRTFSKAFGLAALRIGYVIAQPDYIQLLRKVRGPFDVNMVAATVVKAALKNVNEMTKYAEEVMVRAKPLVEAFFRQNSIRFYGSSGNFILLAPNEPHAVFETLKQAGVLVRPQDKPSIEGTLRLTITTLEQMQEFIDIYERTVLS